jgi:hypothetical protein
VPDEADSGSATDDSGDPVDTGGESQYSDAGDASDADAPGLESSYDPCQFVSGTQTYAVLTTAGEEWTLV